MSNWLDWLWGFFRAPMKIAVRDTPKVTGTAVGQVLSQYCKNLWISDGEFNTMDMRNVTDFLKVNPVNDRKYVNEAHDCDDFSYELMGDISTWNSAGAFGMVWGNRAVDGAPHAWNFFIDPNLKVWYVEPQNDFIFAPSSENVWILII